MTPGTPASAVPGGAVVSGPEKPDPFSVTLGVHYQPSSSSSQHRVRNELPRARCPEDRQAATRMRHSLRVDITPTSNMGSGSLRVLVSSRGRRAASGSIGMQETAHEKHEGTCGAVLRGLQQA